LEEANTDPQNAEKQAALLKVPKEKKKWKKRKPRIKEEMFTQFAANEQA
jgi:hypothetical protein